MTWFKTLNDVPPNWQSCTPHQVPSRYTFVEISEQLKSKVIQDYMALCTNQPVHRHPCWGKKIFPENLAAINAVIHTAVEPETVNEKKLP